MRPKLQSAAGLVFALVLTSLIAAIGSATGQPDRWYEQLAKPGWIPPGWVFGLVWMILYATMALAVWLVWLQRGHAHVRPAIMVWLVQLLINGMWSPLFFRLHEIKLAFALVCLLWLLILLTIVLFSHLHRGAAALMVPYLMWVTLAAVMNYTIWQYNLP